MANTGTIDVDDMADGISNEPDPLSGLDLVGNASIKRVLEDEGHDEEDWCLDQEVKPNVEGLQVMELHEEPLGVVVDFWVDLEPEDEDETEEGEDLMD